MFAIQISQFGGREVLQPVELPQPVPKGGEAVVELDAVGVNFIDTYQRSGFYKVPLPGILGCEGAGVVVSVGDGVTEVAIGDRVAFAGPLGAYAQFAAVSAQQLVPIPDRINFVEAAAALLQGMTAHYLVRGAYLVKHGDNCLVHAAAGGVGALLVQFIKYFGGNVIAVVGSAEKGVVAQEAGADAVIVSQWDDFERVTKERCEGGVEVVYDSVGKDTFDRSLRCLKPLGTLVTYGQSSGAVPPLDLLRLSEGSFFITRPTLRHYVATRDQLLHRANTVFELLLAARLQLRIDCELPLKDAQEAHRRLESRESKGKIILLPKA